MNILGSGVDHPQSPTCGLSGDTPTGYWSCDLLLKDPPLGEPLSNFPPSCGCELALLGC
jgi:hypothetical protein